MSAGDVIALSLLAVGWVVSYVLRQRRESGRRADLDAILARRPVRVRDRRRPHRVQHMRPGTRRAPASLTRAMRGCCHCGNALSS